jgi:hypothetical protein
VGSQRLTAWAMARPIIKVTQFWKLHGKLTVNGKRWLY